MARHPTNKEILKSWAIVLGVAALLFIVINLPSYWTIVRTSLRPAPKPVALVHNQKQEQGSPNLLEIPSLGITAPVVYVDQDNENAFQAGLKNGVVHYPGTALPGQGGNVYIFGHSSDYFWSDGHYKTVFAALPQIKKGAEISLSDAQGNVYNYVVVDTVVASPDDVQYLSQGDGRKKILTVQTSYPVGTALRRFLAIAELK